MDVIPILLAQTGLSKLGIADWHMMAFICIGFGTVGYYLLQLGILRSKTWALIGGVLITTACLLAAVSQKLTFESVILFTFFGLAIASGVAFLVARQSVNAALGFASAVLAGAGVLFMQSAIFVAAATIIVYAGATIIVFLFVLMFSQQLSLESYELKLNRPWMAALLGGIMLSVIVYALSNVEDNTADMAKASLSRPLSQETISDVPRSTAGLGRSMFTEYLITVELAGTLLLAATIGAIAVAQRTLEVDS